MKIVIIIFSLFIGSIPAWALSEKSANELLDHFFSIYQPIIKSTTGASLEIRRDWSINESNAEADRHGSEYSIILSGGLLKKGDLSLPGLAAVACHELGHIIGGAPQHNQYRYAWFGYEGQADYFASLKCLKILFANPYFSSLPKRQNREIKNLCSETYTDKKEIEICERAALAGQDMIHYFQDIEKQDEPLVQFDTPLKIIAGGTYSIYPSYQCRLDTFLAGALCSVPVGNALSDKNPLQGTCSQNSFPKGARPACWFIESEWLK